MSDGPVTRQRALQDLADRLQAAEAAAACAQAQVTRLTDENAYLALALSHREAAHITLMSRLHLCQTELQYLKDRATKLETKYEERENFHEEKHNARTRKIDEIITKIDEKVEVRNKNERNVAAALDIATQLLRGTLEKLMSKHSDFSELDELSDNFMRVMPAARDSALFIAAHDTFRACCELKAGVRHLYEAVENNRKEYDTLFTEHANLKQSLELLTFTS